LRLKAEALVLLGRVETARGCQELARKHLHAARNIYVTLGLLWPQIEIEQNLAAIDIDHRDYEQAVRSLELAQQLVKQIGVPSLTLSVLCDLANAYLRAGAREQALAIADEALKTASKINVPLTAADAFLTIGSISTE